MAAAINQLAPPDGKAELAKQLGVSRSSLYYAPRLPAKDLKLKAEIEKVMSVHSAYGQRRIAIELKVNKKRIKRVMKLFGLKVRRRRKKPSKPNDLGQAPMAIPNLVLGLIIGAPQRVWVSDFTYLPHFAALFIWRRWKMFLRDKSSAGRCQRGITLIWWRWLCWTR
jgi:transposase InsO family protein